MILPLKHTHWQMLRTVLRAEAAGGPLPTGRELRLVLGQKTRDGTFLDELVDRGFLERAGKPAAASTPAQDPGAAEPEQFRTRYKLTAKGRHAAEYGEYEVQFPGAAPVAQPPRPKGKRK